MTERATGEGRRTSEEMTKGNPMAASLHSGHQQTEITLKRSSTADSDDTVLQNLTLTRLPHVADGPSKSQN